MGGFRFALGVSSFRLRARLGFSVPSTSPARQQDQASAYAWEQERDRRSGWRGDEVDARMKLFRSREGANRGR
jgi:hypothetical protein